MRYLEGVAIVLESKITELNVELSQLYVEEDKLIAKAVKKLKKK